MKLEELKNNKIIILGFGKEGKDSFRFLRRLWPRKLVGIADQNLKLKIKNLKFVEWHLGENYLKTLKNYDIIIKSPGIPIHLPEIEKAYKERKITSSTEIFFENCPGKIIGVTGTKGKGTTALLIYQILKKGGLKAHLVGNIGKPVLQLLFSATPKDIYVYELSSHQLYNLKKSPQIVVFLNIYPDHLDYYKNFKEYALAKANICRYQKKNDYLIYNSDDKIIREIAKKTKAKKILFHSKDKILKSSPLTTPYSPSLSLGLAPRFQNFVFFVENIIPAITVGKIFGISDKKISQVIKNFKPLPHRLEYVGNFKGIKFYNDSASTIPEATIFALDSLKDKVQTILLGGSEKKVSFKNLAKRILKSEVKNLIFFPTTGKRIWKELKELISFQKELSSFFVNNMSEAVKLAYQYTEKRKICLLSPASASFSIFRDYKERGNLFKKYIKIYGKNGKKA